MATAPSGEKSKSIIVIKRIKKGGHGGHSAAWKIAYADFVTAMMAFFLLMWLLGSTTKGDLKGIADYFNSPLQVAMQGGDGSGDATSLITGGGQDLTKSVGQVKRGDNNTKKRAPQQERDEIQKTEREKMRKLKERVEAAIQINPKLSEMHDQIRVEITPDGLRIQIIDDFKRPMFALGSAQVQPYMRELLHEIGKVLNDVQNQIALTGHTDSAQYAAGERGYSNWELSADRANASRRELIVGGMHGEKVVRVVGLADSALLDKNDPKSPMNRRISIIVLNKMAEERMAQAQGEIETGSGEQLRESLDGQVTPETQGAQETQETSGSVAATPSAQVPVQPSANPVAQPSTSASVPTSAPASSPAAPVSAPASAPTPAPTPAAATPPLPPPPIPSTSTLGLPHEVDMPLP